MTENPEEIQQIMTAGESTQFWKLIQEVIQTQVDSLEKQILDDSAFDVERIKEFRWKLKIHKRFKDLPQFIISKIKGGEQTQKIDFDAYE